MDTVGDLQHAGVEGFSASRVYSFDFKLFNELVTGQTISLATVTATPGTSPALTLGSPTISGSQVNVNLSSGAAGTLYTIKVDITTSGGSVIEAQLPLTCR